MTEKLNQYQQAGYKTFPLAVGGLQWWAENKFGGDLDEALAFVLADIDEQDYIPEHIEGIREAHRWLKDQEKLKE